ncbi:hypothetical protein [Bdellovibrio sp.]|uniref:hypothetical protein n=1 Tax=Bdellovibrio sp. TaxID=28201 RepID=UPI0039E2BA26
MQASKKTFIQTILSIYALSSLAGCNLPSPKDKTDTGSGAATFTVQAMAEKSKALETSVQGDFALPSSKVFNLQACVKDVAYDKAISGHEFLVEEVNKTVVTDKAGCLTWAERINYNFLGESQYIRIERSIKGLGLHKGHQNVAFAINPWSHGETLTPVLNPNDGNNIPRLVDDQEQGKMALKGFSSDNKATVRPLWVEDGRLFVTEQKMTKDGVVLLVEMRPNPSIQLTKMNGETFLRPLTAGTFKARLKLIHLYQQNDKEIRRLLSESEVMTVKMENASLAIKSSMSLPALPTRGQIIIGMELQPVNGPQGLTGFDGIYLLGEYDQIKGSSFLKLNTVVAQTKDFKIANFVNSSLTEVSRSSQTGAVEAETYQKPKVEVSQLEFRFIRVGEEKTATREVFYNIRACVRHGLDQKTTRSHTFKITKFRQSETETSSTALLKTDNNSCLNWDEKITFKYFDCQHYLKGFVQIENQDLGMNEKLDIIVNPWESNGGALARDMRYVEPTEKLILSCSQENRPKTQVMLDGFSYNTLSYNYGIDSLLNLTVTKKIQFKMDTRLLIYSSLSNGRAEVQKLRDGIYMLRLAVVQNRDYDTNNTYVTSSDKLVNVINGQVNTDITFQTQDLKALGNRNNLLVEIYPVDENKVDLKDGQVIQKDTSAPLTSLIDESTGLEVPTFIGPITLNTDEASRPLRMIDASAISSLLLTGHGQNNSSEKFLIQKVITEGQKVRAEKYKTIQARADKVQFSKENNLELISLKTADAQAPLVKALVGSTQLNPRLIVTKADLQEIITKGTLTPQTAQKLCAFWGGDYFKKLYAEKGGVTMKHVMGFGMDCYHAVAKDPARFFQVEKQLLIKEVGGSQFVKGLNQGLSVGTSFSLSTSQSAFSSRTTSINAKIGLSKKFLDVLSVGVDFGYAMSWGVSDSKTSSNSVSVSGSTSMTVQQNTFKVRVNKHEQCAVVRLNPTLFIKDTKSWFGRRDYLAILNPQLSAEEMATATTRGLMICEGEVRTEAKDIMENYYLIAQESGSSQMQDNGDARNRNFFITLRSSNDFNRFVLAMRGQVNMPASHQQKEETQEQATQMMEQLFKMSGPAYPGVYLAK